MQMEEGGLPANKASRWNGEENRTFMWNGDQNEIQSVQNA